jgi:hypothetical protein
MRRLTATAFAVAAFMSITSPASAAPPRVAASAEVRCLEAGGIATRVCGLDGDRSLVVTSRADDGWLNARAASSVASPDLETDGR